MTSKSEHRACTATRADGRPCAAPSLASGFCFGHDPTLSAQRAAGRRRGGRNKATLVRHRRLAPPRLVPVFERLERAMEAVEAGGMEPRVAHALAALANAEARIVAVGELEERLRTLERALEAQQQRGRPAWPA